MIPSAKGVMSMHMKQTCLVQAEEVFIHVVCAVTVADIKRQTEAGSFQQVLDSEPFMSLPAIGVLNSDAGSGTGQCILTKGTEFQKDGSKFRLALVIQVHLALRERDVHAMRKVHVDDGHAQGRRDLQRTTGALQPSCADCIIEGERVALLFDM